MTNDTWLDVVEKVKKTCAHVEEAVLPLLDHDGTEIDRGTVHVLEFDSPDGTRYRLEREKKPRVLDRHQTYSGRAGTAAQVSYDVSDSEFTDHVALFSEDEYGEWQAVPLERMGF